MAPRIDEGASAVVPLITKRNDVGVVDEDDDSAARYVGEDVELGDSGSAVCPVHAKGGGGPPLPSAGYAALPVTHPSPSSSPGPGSTPHPAHFLKIALCISVWYTASLVTLFLNKIILSMPNGDVHVLGAVQMMTTALFGGIHVFGPATASYLSRAAGLRLGRKTGARALPKRVTPTALAMAGGGVTPPVPSKAPSPLLNYSTVRDLLLMGLLRGATVILGLVSISHVAISFTETIKASAPLFTVVFSYFILGERTSAPVIGTLLPVAVGLVVCSAYELDYDVIGLVAAVLNNCIACVQNVWSKKILSKGVLSPSQLQFFTSISAIALQMPLAIRMGTSTTLFTWSFLKTMDGIDTKLWQCILVNAVAYHLQSVSAFYTMSCMCPVSMSVANTTKRAIMIFLSILYFGNPVSGNTVVGMVLVMVGVFLYNHMRRMYPSMARK